MKTEKIGVILWHDDFQGNTGAGVMNAMEAAKLTQGVFDTALYEMAEKEKGRKLTDDEKRIIEKNRIHVKVIKARV